MPQSVRSELLPGATAGVWRLMEIAFDRVDELHPTPGTGVVTPARTEYPPVHKSITCFDRGLLL